MLQYCNIVLVFSLRLEPPPALAGPLAENDYIERHGKRLYLTRLAGPEHIEPCEGAHKCYSGPQNWIEARLMLVQARSTRGRATRESGAAMASAPQWWPTRAAPNARDSVCLSFLHSLEPQSVATQSVTYYWCYGALDAGEEYADCGRPLGMRCVNGSLYVADAKLGLLRVAVAAGARAEANTGVETLVRAEQLVDAFPMRNLNAVEMLPDGRLVLTQPDDTRPHSENVYSVLEHLPNGRL